MDEKEQREDVKARLEKQANHYMHEAQKQSEEIKQIHQEMEERER